jgi:hypothetical protein
VESTWERRDLPVLEAVVKLFDERPEVIWVSVKGIADEIGMDTMDVYRAAKALSPRYLEFTEMLADLPDPHRISHPTEDARRAVGQWPSPDVWADRIIRGLQEAAEREPDPARRSRLRATAEGLASFGRDVLVGVLSGGITRGMDS